MGLWSQVPRPDLIYSARSPGAWTQTPSRSSVRSRPKSTARMSSRCRPPGWCPMQLCYCGRAGPCRPPLDPNQAPIPNKAPAPNTSCFLRLLWGSPAGRQGRLGPSWAGEGAAPTCPLSNLSPSWQAWLLGLCPLGSSFSTEGLSGSSEGKVGPSTGSAGAASRSLYTDMHRTTSRWGHFNTMHKGTAPQLAELQLCTQSHDTPTPSQPAGTQADSHMAQPHY